MTGWCRALLAMGVLTVALCVVGMHQLSSSHSFVTANPGRGAHGHPAATYPGLGHHHETAADDDDPTPAVAHAVTSVSPTSGCDGCADHAALFASCLLALTLLVLSWLLAPPRPRRIPPVQRTFWVVPLSGPGRVRPPLSLVELSVRRT